MPRTRLNKPPLVGKTILFLIRKMVQQNKMVPPSSPEILFGVEQNNYPQGTNKSIKKLISRCYLPSIISIHKH